MGLLGKILPVAGAIGGFIMGGPGGAAIGSTLGMLVGGGGGRRGAGQQNVQINLPTTYGPRLADLRTLTSSYGGVIPKIYGNMRISGNIIWATDIREVTHESKSVLEGSSNVVTTRTDVTYEYYVTMAIAICEGEITELTRVWAGDRLLDINTLGSKDGKFNIHLGSPEQMPDEIMLRYKEPGSCPAYRDLCYIVIEDFALGAFDNRIPNFSFEVRREVRFRPCVEDKIKEIVLIPGAGEFVYSDIIHTKHRGEYNGNNFTETGKSESMNMHNNARVPNMRLALDQLCKSLPNLEWVALVVTWFATSSNAGCCRIVPKVEYSAEGVEIRPSDWGVAGLNRDNAEHVLRFDDNTPTYGGSPSDNSVIAICRELRKRGLKVMLYPMIFVDEITPDAKPWRGRIRASSNDDIKSFFNNHEGYNRFIRHYAELSKGLVDAFVIGSEMIGLTSFTASSGSYRAVNEFIYLAKQVKNITAKECLVIYAADWSEYHHTDGGWYNLDPLWACDAIDIVGIDAYFPLTEDLPAGSITEELIRRGWESGEGWSYYWNHDRTKKDNLDSAWAWKNIEYWWKNKHINPDGKSTAWQPKMKPIWFTELGFPSVDACSNQPNVFYDPTSIESYFPRGSRGQVNFLAQRQALNASFDFLNYRCKLKENKELVPKRFVWCWDARPYPQWPDMLDVWQDGILWATGHWLNGKLGISTLGAIIADILSASGLMPYQYDVSLLKEDVAGFVVAENCSLREVIEQLQAAYFFDVVESNGALKFIPRAIKTKSDMVISHDDLVPEKSEDSISGKTLETVIIQELELPEKISLTFIDRAQNYNYSTHISLRQSCSTRQHVDFTLPIVMSNNLAKQVADIAMYNAWMERTRFYLTLPPKYMHLQPSDIITVTSINNVHHQMRIVKIDVGSNHLLKIEAVAFDVSIYDFYCKTNYLEHDSNLPMSALESVANTILHIFDIPIISDTLVNINNPTISCACLPSGDNWQGAIIYLSADGGNNYKQLTTITQKAITGIVKSHIDQQPEYIKDENSKLIVQINMDSILPEIPEGGYIKALIGNEIITIEKLELLYHKDQIRTYCLSILGRGRYSTKIRPHEIGEHFILLDQAIEQIELDDHLIGRDLVFKAVSIGNSLAVTDETKHKFTASSLKPLAPTNLEVSEDGQNNLIISWQRSDRAQHIWSWGGGLPMSEQEEKYEIDIINGNELIRCLTATSESTTYPLDLIAEDQLQPDIEYSAVIYQLSAKIGRGYPATVIFKI